MKSCCVHINNDRMRNVYSYTLWNWQEMHIFTVDRCVLKSWSWPSSLQTSLISHTLSDQSPPFTTGQLPNLSIHFNGHFPREPGLAGVFWSKEWWRWWWQLDYWSYKSCKVPVKSSPPTNQNPVFFYRPDVLPIAQPTVSKHWREGQLLNEDWNCMHYSTEWLECNHYATRLCMKGYVTVGMVYYGLTSHSTQYTSSRRRRPWAVIYISHSVIEGQRHNNPLNPRCFCLQRPKQLAPNPHYSGGS